MNHWCIIILFNSTKDLETTTTSVLTLLFEFCYRCSSCQFGILCLINGIIEAMRFD